MQKRKRSSTCFAPKIRRQETPEVDMFCPPKYVDRRPLGTPQDPIEDVILAGYKHHPPPTHPSQTPPPLTTHCPSTTTHPSQTTHRSPTAATLAQNFAWMSQSSSSSPHHAGAVPPVSIDALKACLRARNHLHRRGNHHQLGQSPGPSCGGVLQMAEWALSGVAAQFGCRLSSSSSSTTRRFYCSGRQCRCRTSSGPSQLFQKQRPGHISCSNGQMRVRKDHLQCTGWRACTSSISSSNAMPCRHRRRHRRRQDHRLGGCRHSRDHRLSGLLLPWHRRPHLGALLQVHWWHRHRRHPRGHHHPYRRHPRGDCCQQWYRHYGFHPRGHRHSRRRQCGKRVRGC